MPSTSMDLLRALCERVGVPPPVVHEEERFGHRHRARLAIRGRARSPKVGLFQAGSHRIVDIPNCRVHHPLINEAAQVLRQAMRETGIPPYADRPHAGALRYVQVVVDRAASQVQVVLVGNGETPDVLGDLPDVYARLLGNRLQGLFFNSQPDRSNSIFGANTTHLAGHTTLREVFGGADVFYPPGAFGQNHLPLFSQAVDRISELTPSKEIIAEFYSGVGAIGLGLLKRSHQVRFNEQSPDGLRGLEAGIAARPASERERAQVFPGAAGDCLEGLRGAGVVIVDPPRKGLDQPLLQALVRSPPQRLIYLACGLPSLLKELELLHRPDGLQIQSVEVFDFFPFTEHVETLVCLTRKSDDLLPIASREGFKTDTNAK